MPYFNCYIHFTLGATFGGGGMFLIAGLLNLLFKIRIFCRVAELCAIFRCLLWVCGPSVIFLVLVLLLVGVC